MRVTVTAREGMQIDTDLKGKLRKICGASGVAAQTDSMGRLIYLSVNTDELDAVLDLIPEKPERYSVRVTEEPTPQKDQKKSETSSKYSFRDAGKIEDAQTELKAMSGLRVFQTLQFGKRLENTEQYVVAGLFAVASAGLIAAGIAFWDKVGALVPRSDQNEEAIEEFLGYDPTPEVKPLPLVVPEEEDVKIEAKAVPVFPEAPAP